MEASSLSEEAEVAFAVIGAIITSLGILTQVATFVLATNPELLAQVRHALGVVPED